MNQSYYSIFTVSDLTGSIFRGDDNWTECPVNLPTVRNSRKSLSWTSSSKMFLGSKLNRGSLRLDPTDEGDFTYPLNFFGRRAGESYNLMRKGNLFENSWTKFFLRILIPYTLAMYSIRGQRTSKGIKNCLFAISDWTNNKSRRIPGSSRSNIVSVLVFNPRISLVLRYLRKFSLRKIVSMTQNVFPGLFFGRVDDPHRRVLWGPPTFPDTSSLRMETIKRNFKIPKSG